MKKYFFYIQYKTSKGLSFYKDKECNYPRKTKIWKELNQLLKSNSNIDSILYSQSFQ